VRITDLGVLLSTPAEALIESASVLDSPEPVVIEPSRGLDDGVVDAAGPILRQLPAPTVLIGETSLSADLVGAVDMCLTPEPDPPRPWVNASVDDVVDGVGRNPLAALSLVVLLRSTEHLPTWNAIAEESAAYALLLGSAGFHEWLARRGPSSPKPHVRPPVDLKRVGDVLQISLDRPETRNAIDSATRDALVEGLRLAALDPSTLVEIRGRGPCFCAGGDVEEFGTVKDPATAHAVRLTRHPGIALDTVASRVTCYLHGQCIGAGIEIPAFASTVVAAPSATFSLPEVGMGLIPGAGGTVSIPRRIGRQRTAWLAVTGATIDAPTALGWGLVDALQAR
jgi:hypothetical protein